MKEDEYLSNDIFHFLFFIILYSPLLIQNTPFNSYYGKFIVHLFVYSSFTLNIDHDMKR